MNILGISSATGTIGAAIVGGGNITAECSISGITARSERLIALIDNVLEQAKLKIRQINAVAVITGPGSYSGLRGGLATAKGLVSTLDIPILSVATLDAVAYNFIDTDGMVAVAINACRDEYNMALFGISFCKVRRLTRDMTVKTRNIAEALAGVEGSIRLACDRDLSGEIKNKNIILASPDSVVPWARNAARIGAIKLQKGDISDTLELKPEYSHKPNIREYKK